MNLKESKHDLLRHFLEGSGHPIRINPRDFNQYSPEEETLLTMYILEKMPYLKLYHSTSWNETMVMLQDEIPIKDKLYYYKTILKEERNYYFQTIEKIHDILRL